VQQREHPFGQSTYYALNLLKEWITR